MNTQAIYDHVADLLQFTFATFCAAERAYARATSPRWDDPLFQDSLLHFRQVHTAAAPVPEWSLDEVVPVKYLDGLFPRLDDGIKGLEPHVRETIVRVANSYRGPFSPKYAFPGDRCWLDSAWSLLCRLRIWADPERKIGWTWEAFGGVDVPELVERLRAECLQVVGQQQPRMDADAGMQSKNKPLYVGDGVLRIKGMPYKLELGEQAIVEFILKNGGAVNDVQLRDNGFDQAARTLKKLASLQGLEEFVRIPGGKGKGGYRLIFEDFRNFS